MDFRDLEAVQSILKLLDGFEPAEQGRIVRWVTEKLGLGAPPPAGASTRTDAATVSSQNGKAGANIELFASTADLMAAVNAHTASDRALVVAVFLQYCSGRDSLTGFEINAELRHLGHAVANITDTIDALQRTKPALMIQIRKSGTSKQARKLYKVTDAGYRRVLQMVDEGNVNEEP